MERCDSISKISRFTFDFKYRFVIVKGEICYLSLAIAVSQYENYTYDSKTIGVAAALGRVFRRKVVVRPLQDLMWKVDVRLPGKGISNSHGARPVHLSITMIQWIRTSRLSMKNSPFLMWKQLHV